MPRFSEGEIDDADDQRRYNLHQGVIAKQMRSRKGQAFLRELIASLEALPEKRLVNDAVAKDGCVCGLGAIALRRRVDAGEDRDAVLADLANVEVDVRDGDEHVSEWAERELGAQQNVASAIAWTTDADEGTITPEQRYERVLSWAKSQVRS